IDRFMSECRALTNTMGNGVASIVIAAWEKEMDRDKLKAALAKPVVTAGTVAAQEGEAIVSRLPERETQRPI
ncbi:MAG: hypothetical protein ACN6PY_02840, partial [Paraburkholderia nemoris]